MSSKYILSFLWLVGFHLREASLCLHYSTIGWICENKGLRKTGVMKERVAGILFCFLLFFFSLVPEYQCVTSLHICSDRRLQPKRVDSGGFDSLKTMQNLFWSFTFSFRELSKWLRSRQLDGYGGREDIGKNTCTLAADLHVNRNIFS